MDGDASADLLRVADAWDKAMVENDAEAIGSFMAEDWMIIGSDGGVSDKPTFLALVKSGDLTHDVMTTEDAKIRIYGEVAVVTAHGVSGGSYRGQRFRETERVSCVFVKQAGSWRCVLTHLSRLAQE